MGIKNKVHREMESLRSILQSMKEEQRQRSLLSMPASIRSRLLDFMQKRCGMSTDLLPGVEPQVDAPHYVTRCRFNPGSLRRIRLQHRVKYQSCIRFKALRVYTREHTDIEVAVEQQLILASVRQRVSKVTARDPTMWLNTDRITKAWADGFAQCGTTEEDLGLRTFLEFPASPWLNSRRLIASP